jgi:quercetin dioxygenase-like cupin family protein
MQSWNLLAVDAPNGTRDPVVLQSDDAARAVLIRIDAGQELGEHQVKERAWVCVVEGTVRVRAGGETMDAAPGTLLRFDADERRSLGSDEGARILMLLAPWPGVGHYRGEHQASSA